MKQPSSYGGGARLLCSHSRCNEFRLSLPFDFDPLSLLLLSLLLFLPPYKHTCAPSQSKSTRPTRSIHPCLVHWCSEHLPSLLRNKHRAGGPAECHDSFSRPNSSQSKSITLAINVKSIVILIPNHVVSHSPRSSSLSSHLLCSPSHFH